MKKQKVLLGLGIPEVEHEIRQKFNNNEDILKYDILKDVIIHSEPKHIIDKINHNDPDILVLREGLSGESELIPIIYAIAKNYNIRIVFIARHRIPGDKLLATLTMYSVYDILSGTQIDIDQIVDTIKNPKNIKDVIEYLPKPNANDDYDQLIFEADEKSASEINKQINKDPYGTIKGRQDIEDNLIIEKDQNKEQNKNNKDNKEINAKSLAAEAKLQEKKERQKKNKIDKEEKIVMEKSLKEEQLKVEKAKEAKRLEREKAQLEVEKKKIELEKAKIKKAKEEEKKKKENLKREEPKTQKSSGGLFSGLFGGPEEKKNIKNKDNVQRIISFYSVRSGIGNTFVSLNSAIDLAHQGYKVLYIELDDKNPSTALWYDLRSKMFGLEDSLQAVNYNEYKTINGSILTKQDILQQESDIIGTHKKFPDTLDFLLFSNEYVYSSVQQKINNNSLQKLLMYLLHQLKYNYIIIDVNHNCQSSLVESLLLLSYKNVILFNQDVSTVSTFIRFLQKLEEKGIGINEDEFGVSSNIDDKNIFLLNNYSKKSKFNIKSMKVWTKLEDIAVMSSNTEDIYDSLFLGQLIYQNTNNRDFKNDLKNLTSSL